MKQAPSYGFWWFFSSLSSVWFSDLPLGIAILYHIQRSPRGKQSWQNSTCPISRRDWIGEFTNAQVNTSNANWVWQLIRVCHRTTDQGVPRGQWYGRMFKFGALSGKSGNSNRRKFRSQTSDNMDRWKAEQGRGREKRKIKRKKSRRERVRRKKMQMREKVGKPRETLCFSNDLGLRRVEK